MIETNKNPEVITINLSGISALNREKLRSVVVKAISYYIGSKRPPQLQFDDYGKPYVLDNNNLAFSYAHSKTMLTLIVNTSVSAVGIDTENISRLHEIVAISDQAFSKEELETIEHKDMLFWWCLKEAAVKQLGKGFRDADPSELTIKTVGNSYKLYMSQSEVIKGYYIKKYCGDDLIVACSDQKLNGIQFSDANFIDLTKDTQ